MPNPSQDPLYSVWFGIINRCTKPENKHYDRYGGRGIKICERWLTSFINFKLDMGTRPKGLTIERLNNDGDYEPNNCIWATRKEQNINKCNTIMVSYNGELISLRKIFNYLPYREYNRLYQRWMSGWTLEQLLAEPTKKHTRKVLRGRPSLPKYKKLAVKPENIKEFATTKHNEGLSYKSIGIMVGLSRQHIHHIVKGRKDRGI